MRLHVSHQTAYRYEGVVASAAQTLRLTPRTYEGMTVLGWKVWTDSRRELPAFTDGYGNVTHTHAVNHPHDEVTIFVEGDVETVASHGVIRGTYEPLPPLFYLRQTDLTAPDAAIDAMAREAAGAGKVLKQLHALLHIVRDRLDYRVGLTDPKTTAATALAAGAGVCQDHAHVFIAAARTLGIPARYVGGYLWTGFQSREYEASHAWAEAF